MRRSKVTLLFSLTCSVDFFMLGPYRPYNKPTFLALIPPSFTSLNPFVTFFRPFEPDSSSHNWGKYENSRFNCDAFGYIQKMQSRETSGAHESSRLQMSEENFRAELSRITFYDYVIYPKLYYSFRYEINLIRIMYTANSSILYSKEKTVWILGT